MFRVAASSQLPQGVRGMATLKEISTRLKSVKSIQKITKSMKMVSAAKYARADKALQDGRPNGRAANALFEKNKIEGDAAADKQVLILVSSDRGLCGGVHSGIVKFAKLALKDTAKNVTTKIVPVGDKARVIIARTHGSNILFSVNEIGRKPPIFAEASFVAQNLLKSDFDFAFGKILYNQFKSAISYKAVARPFFSINAVESNSELNSYDNLDKETLQSYVEFSLANNLFYAMLENAASEQSARMSAMDNASSNAGDMISSLQLTFNRTRQAVITRELIEIISGAAALD